MRRLPQVDELSWCSPQGTLLSSLYFTPTTFSTSVDMTTEPIRCSTHHEVEQLIMGDSMRGHDGFYVGCPSSLHRELDECDLGSPVWPVVFRASGFGSKKTSSCESNSNPTDILQFVSHKELHDEYHSCAAWLPDDGPSNRSYSFLSNGMQKANTDSSQAESDPPSPGSILGLHLVVQGILPLQPCGEFSMDDIFEPEIAGDVEYRR